MKSFMQAVVKNELEMLSYSFPSRIYNADVSKLIIQATAVT